MKNKWFLGVLAFATVATAGLYYLSHRPPPPVDKRVELALARGVAAILKFQSADGAFQSDQYGAFRQNLSLTPHALLALQSLPEHLQTADVREGRKRAAARLAAFARDLPDDIPYAVYTVAGALQALAREPEQSAAIAPLADLLRRHQLAEARGWSPGDLSYGGWGYTNTLPDKPAPSNAPLSAVNSNLSATLYALEALRAAGVPASDPAIQKAVNFVHRCQNFAIDRQSTAFDDGGFFFSPEEVMRNKAAEAGIDVTGTRFRSYGAMTCDGARALLLCGATPESPDVAAALKWLRDHFSVEEQPGDFPPDRQLFKLGMYYYYLSSLAQTGDAARGHLPEGWQTQLAEELLARQGNDGTWVSRYTDAKEDDPLVATSEAVAALSRTFGPGR